ncbi:uncharacterized protein LOC124441606 [Xenia sp. Carnegie-2017]|uniref:uncharacterized protein LOC124441606 n=1 Tax=Xenia sp. Carnegie-2017 TaxID=2897299 RepID=UPI001F04F28D|nr:uncharacterized protein LOC124441606 [Xenia sp. Carnegie-2017]
MLDLTSANHKVWWEDGQLPFDHIPFVQVNHRVYDCRHGVDRHSSQKKKNRTSNSSDHSFKKHRNMFQGTKKLNCSAQVHMREYIKFPDFRAGGLHQGIDKILVSKIQELVVAGACSVKDVRMHLKIYVEQDLYKATKAPAKTNRRFYPSKQTIRSHQSVSVLCNIYKAVIKERFSKFDQENLQKKIEDWKLRCSDESFFFRPLAKYSAESLITQENSVDNEEDDDDDDDDNTVLPESKNGLLFIHQTVNQKRLLKRYGNELTLLDATYKTTKYSLALFFLVVKTNVSYQVVGSFVLQSETSYAIAEALQVIRGWNNEWNLAYFMVDYPEEEMSEINRVFAGCQTYICDFYREQAWERWLSKSSNGLLPLKKNDSCKTSINCQSEDGG